MVKKKLLVNTTQCKNIDIVSFSIITENDSVSILCSRLLDIVSFSYSMYTLNKCMYYVGFVYVVYMYKDDCIKEIT